MKASKESNLTKKSFSELNTAQNQKGKLLLNKIQDQAQPLTWTQKTSSPTM